LAVDMGRKSVKVAVDAMGGDYAPQEIVKGAIQAAEKDGVELILVGCEDAVQRELKKYDVSSLPIHVVNASEVIREDESPVTALRQKLDASVLVAMRLVKEGGADAVVSMGYTGAVVVSAIEILGTLEGIKRPTAGSFLCSAPDTLVFDLGPNADCKARDLLSFAVIGSVVAQKILHISNPTVALLSTGAEEGKGNLLVKKAYPLFKASPLNFIGNVEGHDIPFGRANVIVCDGFTGNILLKFCEGLGDSIIERLRVTLDKRLPEEELDAIISDLFALTHIADVAGGGMIYGVNGVVWIGHGRSKAPQVTESIHQVKLAVEANLLEEIRLELRKL
jgi:glycerol-3-phosphate acyltransferase PlsX